MVGFGTDRQGAGTDGVDGNSFFLQDPAEGTDGAGLIIQDHEDFLDLFHELAFRRLLGWIHFRHPAWYCFLLTFHRSKISRRNSPVKPVKFLFGHFEPIPGMDCSLQ